MSSTIACPGCNVALRIPAELPAGKRIRCPHCGATLAPDGPANAPRGVITTPSAPAAARLVDQDSPRSPSPAERPAPPRKRFRTAAIVAALCLVVALVVCGAVMAALAFLGSLSNPVSSPQATTSGVVKLPGQPAVNPGPAGPAGPGPVGPPGPQVGEPAPEIDGKDLDGKDMKLSDFRGKVVVLDFWGDWCPFCKSAYTYQRHLVRRMEGRSFVLLGVNCDQTVDQARLVARNQRLNWRSWWDGSADMGGPTYKRWGVQSVPSVFVLDTRGVIRQQFQNAPPEGMLEAVVESLLPAGERGRPRWVAPEALLDRLDKETEVAGYRMRLPRDFVASKREPEEGRQTFLWKHSTLIGGVTQLEVTLRPAAQEEPEDAIEKVLTELPCLRQGWVCMPAERGEVNGLTFHRVNWSGRERRSKQAMQGFAYAARDGDRLILITGRTTEADRTSILLAESAALTFRK